MPSFVGRYANVYILPWLSTYFNQTKAISLRPALTTLSTPSSSIQRSLYGPRYPMKLSQTFLLIRALPHMANTFAGTVPQAPHLHQVLAFSSDQIRQFISTTHNLLHITPRSTLLRVTLLASLTLPFFLPTR